MLRPTCNLHLEKSSVEGALNKTSVLGIHVPNHFKISSWEFQIDFKEKDVFVHKTWEIKYAWPLWRGTVIKGTEKKHAYNLHVNLDHLDVLFLLQRWNMLLGSRSVGPLAKLKTEKHYCLLLLFSHFTCCKYIFACARICTSIHADIVIFGIIIVINEIQNLCRIGFVNNGENKSLMSSNWFAVFCP